MSANSLRIAVCLGRNHAVIRNKGSKCVGALGTHSQVANLSSTHGEPMQRPKPWPYEKRPYGMLWQFFDWTSKRFNDNTKVIVVDSNVGVGKTDFAQKVAKEFDMKFVPDVGMKDLFCNQVGYDIRQLDEQLPERLRTVDIEKFLSATDAKEVYGIGRTQLMWYFKRFFTYAESLEHLLNTGQGLVLERSVFSDMVFADTMAKHGYLTSEGHKYYQMFRENTICELWNPHIFIYLDAPVSYCREQINKRGKAYEVNSKVLTEEYLKTIESNYKDKLLPSLRNTTEVLVYNAQDIPDWEIVVEDLESLDLEGPIEGQEEKFKQWRKRHEDDWNRYRMDISDQNTLKNLFQLPSPWYADELMIQGDDYTTYKKVVLDHPEFRYAPGYNPEKNNVMFKI